MSNQSELVIDIVINDDQWNASSVPVSQIITRSLQKAHEVIATDAKPTTIGVVLSNNKEVQRLNLEWRNKDKPTNVLSFEGPGITPEGGRMLGDIVLAYQVIMDEAAEQSKRFEHHLAHLLIHGYLHLQGMDHEEEAQAIEMERIEIAILHKLGIKNPYTALSQQKEQSS